MKSTQGLYNRYIIEKANGEKTDPNAIYFVLRVDGLGKDINHQLACRKALRVYAEEIKDHLPQLSSDIVELLNGLPQ
jgi:hypothetical protein